MTYQAYPTGGSGSGSGNTLPQRPDQPGTVQNAVRLMWAGAALGVLGVIFTVAFSTRIKRAVGKAAVKTNARLIRQGRKPLTLSQIHSLESATIVILVIVLAIGVLLWLWMAWANGRGNNWARIVASGLFALNTIWFFFVLTRAGVTAIFVGLGWLIGLGAIILLWQRASSDYFSPRLR